MNSEHQLQAQTARHTAEIADILRRFDALSTDIRTLEAGSLELVTGTAPIVASVKAFRRQALSIVAATTTVPGSMSASDKTKLDALFTPESGESVLSADYSIVAASGTFADTGLSVTLPSAGTFIVFGIVRAMVGAAALSYITAKLYNSTDAADVANSEVLALLNPTTTADWQGSAPIGARIPVAASKVIKLYAARTSGGAFSSSSVRATTDGRTKLIYEKVAP